MRIKLFTPLFLLLPLWINAQSNLILDSTHYFLWDTTSTMYKLSERGFFETGSNDSITIQEYLILNGNGDWVNGRKDVFTYDVNDKRTEWLRQSGNATGWQNDWKWSYTYAPSGNCTLRLHEIWNGNTWEYQSKNTYTYNVNNKLTEDFIEVRNGSGWTNSSRYIYTYDGNGRQAEWLMETWNGSTWNASFRSQFTYDVNDNPITELRQAWYGSGWNNNTRLLSVFDQYHRRTSVVVESWNGSQWVNYQRQFHEWHPSGDKTIVSWVRQNGYGLPDWTNVDSTYHYLSTNNTIAVKHISDSLNYKVYPNPNNGTFNIEIPDFSKPVQLRVLNMTGQTVHATQIHSENTAVDLSALSGGTYILLLGSDKGTVQKKMIIR